MKLKILLVSVNHEHPATMHINYYNSLAEVADVEFFGPGFSTEQEMEKGVRRFVEEKGGFDAVICTFPLIMHSIEDVSIREIYRTNRYFISSYSINEAIRYASDMIKEIEQMNILKIILFGQDYININEDWENCLKKLLEKDFYIITWGEDFIPEADESKTIFFGPGLKINNRFLNLVREYKRKVISIPFEAVICNEFYFEPLERRTYDWVVPGNMDSNYPNRSKILDKIESAGYKVFNQFLGRTMPYKSDREKNECYQYNREVDKFIDSSLKANTPYLKNQLTRENLVQWRENYSVSIRQSKVAYADGGNAHTLVQKYMEIPARGTLLVAENVIGLEKMGFVNNENMVVVDTENVLEISEELFNNLEKMQKIAKKGQSLVIEKHTSHHRAKSTVEAVQAILKNTFGGSYWENGNFCVIRN